MANSISAKKRIRQNERRRTQNRARKSAVKTKTKRFLEAVRVGQLDEAQQMFADVQTELDQVGAKGTLHKNTVARRKSRLAKRLNAARKAASA